MTANNKKEFFELLKNELQRIGIEQTDDIFADFEEHFSDSALQGVSEEETAVKLGDVKAIARGYLNLKSSQINSIVAHDVERKRVSLTKPGRSVPADLSLMKNDPNSFKAAQNSDCIRSYTPEHISPEIYPNSAPNSSRTNMGSNNASGGGNNNINYSNSANSQSAQPNGAGTGQSGMGQTENGQTSQTSANAFVNLGKAIGNAAKAAGKAIADSGVKEAFVDAGKTAADAIKEASHNAQDAAKTGGHAAASAAKNMGHSAAHAAAAAAASAAHNVNRTAAAASSSGGWGNTSAKNTARVSDAVPHPSDSFRENNTGSRKGTIPPQYTKAKTSGKYKLIDISGKDMNVNGGKLALALVLDLFVWIWLIPAILGIIFAEGSGVVALIVNAFKSIFGLGAFCYQIFVTRVFLSGAFVALSVLLVCIGVWTVKLLIRLCIYIINQHIMALYDY